MPATTHHIRPWERQLFKQCRRAWDLASRERGNWTPARPTDLFDFGLAVRDAMAVYYFPGMWSWSRAIVRPLATQAFEKSMRTQREAYEVHEALTDEQVEDWDWHLDAGRRLLEGYYLWTEPLDRWTPIQVEALFDVPMPDPAKPGKLIFQPEDKPNEGLLAPDGLGISYRVRIDMAVVDNAGRNFVMDHRLVDEWPDRETMFLDEQMLTRTWSFEREFLVQTRGTIHNELRLPRRGDPDPADRAPESNEQVKLSWRAHTVHQWGGQRYRRTLIRRKRNEVEDMGTRIGMELAEMYSPGLVPYPNPKAGHCGPCLYTAPCLALMRGEDPRPVLTEGFVENTKLDFEPGRLGSQWGFVPHRADETKVRQSLPPSEGDGPSTPG